MDDIEGISQKLDADLDALGPKEKDLRRVCDDLRSQLEVSLLLNWLLHRQSFANAGL